MDEVISSRKINLKKKINILWVILAVLLVVAIVTSYVKFAAYKEGQVAAAGLMLTLTDEFNRYKDDYARLVEEIYDYFNPFRMYGKYDNHELRVSLSQLDKQIGKLLTEGGYECTYLSDYCKYIGFVDYAIHETMVLYIVWVVLAIAFLVVNLWYSSDSKKTMLIDNDRIICKRKGKIEKEFLVKDIKSVESVSVKGLLIRGNSIKYKINMLENANEIKSTIMDALATVPVQSIATTEIKQEIHASSADELRKYKELLDSGVITQEEFDAKKKQLLDL